jgi:tetratricopeptide (TPR) repeat protein
MSFQYPNISLGFLGIKSKDASLSTSFFAELNADNNKMTQYISFPQRVPKVGFFEELCKLEDAKFKPVFETYIKEKKSKLVNLSNSVSNEYNQRKMLNLNYLLLRHGECQYLAENNFSKNFSHDNFLEYQLLKEIVNIEVCLSFNKPIILAGLEELVRQLLNQTGVANLLRIKIVNRLIVCACRYSNQLSPEVKILELAEAVQAIIEKLSFTELAEKVTVSMAYRGMAMVKELGFDRQEAFLQKAELLARQAAPKTSLEEIVVKDNLYTLLQTLSKWNAAKKAYKDAENNLLEMVKIDLHDSTAFSELGIFLFKNGRYDEAAQIFDRAIKLGPPGVGMNMYYYAKCLEKIGKTLEFIEVLEKITSVDQGAVSPWLDIMNYKLQCNDSISAKKIAEHIFNTSELNKQLIPDEIIQIKNLINP